jgi:hypothetical protein
MLPALPRLTEVQSLINKKQYFVLHAPRQSGKTTTVKAEVARINAEGSYYALYCSLECLRDITDKADAMNTLIGSLNRTLRVSNVEALNRVASDLDFMANLKSLPDFITTPVNPFLTSLCARLDKDLIIFFDEADCLIDLVLLSFLSQLRIGYIDRAEAPFPRSIALIGMRNIRDYKDQIRDGKVSLGTSSPFNIITEALTLANFTEEEINTLYAQHTEATGQVFEDEAVQRAWYWTEGQPWLVNALAREVIEKILANDYGPAITVKLIDQAAEILIQRRDTHIDSLLDRLHEERVSQVIGPVINGAWPGKKKAPRDDIDFVLDLGLLKKGLKPGELRPANPIYQEVIIRTLAYEYEDDFDIEVSQAVTNKWVGENRLNMTALLKAFQEHWRENSGDLISSSKGYTEYLPGIVLNAYLQRLLNGGVEYLRREFALGTRRIDLLARYKGVAYPIELKIKANQKSLAESLAQIRDYMDICGAKEGWLMIFNNNMKVKWEKKITWETREYEGVTIHLVGC